MDPTSVDGGSAQTQRPSDYKEKEITTQGNLQRERPKKSLKVDSSPSLAGAPKLCNSDDVSMRDPHCEVMLSGRTSHTRVESNSFFLPD